MKPYPVSWPGWNKEYCFELLQDYSKLEDDYTLQEYFVGNFLRVAYGHLKDDPKWGLLLMVAVLGLNDD